jgi:hypothetical protein
MRNHDGDSYESLTTHSGVKKITGGLEASLVRVLLISDIQMHARRFCSSARCDGDLAMPADAVDAMFRINISIDQLGPLTDEEAQRILVACGPMFRHAEFAFGGRLCDLPNGENLDRRLSKIELPLLAKPLIRTGNGDSATETQPGDSSGDWPHFWAWVALILLGAAVVGWAVTPLIREVLG